MVSALLQLEAFPAGMELFPATDDDAWTLIKRVIDASDYYLVVVGGKYGTVDPATELSFTEKEYDYAIKQGKPVLAFLHADLDKIVAGKSEKSEGAQAKLEDFRAKIQSHKHVKFWNGPEDLAGKVALSFASFRQNYPAVGWIRGDQSTSSEALQEINELRKQVAKLREEKANIDTGPPPGSEALAQGDDSVDFSFTYDIDVRRKSENDYQSVNARGPLDVDVTWNQLFSCVGPEMLNEADESSLRKRIQGWLKREFGDVARGKVTKRVEEEGEAVRRFVGTDLFISDEDFGTLIVQLRALGLITKSDRPRSVKDTKTYWTLTPFGDDHLTLLRAIRRDGPKEDAEVQAGRLRDAARPGLTRGDDGF